MTASEEKYNRVDLLHAWLDARKMRHAHADLRNYFGRVATAFCLAFKIDLDQLATDHEAFPEDPLNDLFRHTLKARQACFSPFSSYLVAPQEIRELFQRHGEPINAVLEAVTCQYDELLLDLLERIFGITSSDFVSRDVLMQCGFPMEPAPDPIDYI
jgi:hypothetical protein